MKHGIDLTGRRIGRLVAQELIGREPKRWRCVCDCGSVVIVLSAYLLSGKKNSCGCLQAETMNVNRNDFSTHKLSKTRTYKTWISMKTRCLKPTHNSYPNYGGKGVKVCERWTNSFEAFLADMGMRPDGMSLDRVDPCGNYEPGNCRWATNEQQQNNKRIKKTYRYQGKRFTLTELANESGINKNTLFTRLSRGWTIERAASEKACARKN